MSTMQDTTSYIEATARAIADEIILRLGVPHPTPQPTTRKELRAQQKAAAIAMRARGATFAEIGEALKVSRATAYQMTKK